MEATGAALAAIIKQMAADQGKSQAALSVESTIAMTTLHRSLNGPRPLSYTEMGLIAQALGTTRTALVTAAEAAETSAA